jgi:ribosomal protein L11 methyltransferase
MSLWPRAHAIATDIDPISIEVTAENAEINDINEERLALAVAEGVNHPLYGELAPFDLVIANILAQPLIELAPSIVATMAPGGTLILAGLLDTQADAVLAAYRRLGMRHADTVQLGDWPTLMLRKRRRVRG